MSSSDHDIEDEAVGWVIRLKHADARAWAEFTEWLEADPAHVQAYDAAALLDGELEALPPRRSAPSTHQGKRRPVDRRGWLTLGAAALAAAAVLVVVAPSMRPADASYVVATAGGERRSVELADGSRIDLNGSTRVVLDRKRPRLARLEQGEALFTVVHDESAPFQVRAGDDLIWDVGTVFNVVQAGGVLRVSVAEGAVVLNPKREAVNLSPGMSLQKQGAKIEVRNGEAQGAGAWNKGRLIYADATVGEVAADLARNLGVSVRADEGIAGQRFTGVLRLDGAPEDVMRRAALLLGVRARRSNEGWTLGSE